MVSSFVLLTNENNIGKKVSVRCHRHHAAAVNYNNNNNNNKKKKDTILQACPIQVIDNEKEWYQNLKKKVTLIPATLTIAIMMMITTTTLSNAAATIDDTGGASSVANAKITTGGASTLQTGRTISITRGVNLDGSDFSNQNLKGVAFQQSIVRDANFKNSNLFGASFFDATLDGSNFENAEMTQVNVEMAQFNRASLKNAIVREMYVSGATLFNGIKDIEGSDWSDTFLRKDQQNYLCDHPTAKGTNPVTGIETRESLMCPP